jgi:hypothetical protein
MIEIRRVKCGEGDPQDHTIVASIVVVPVGRLGGKSPEEVRSVIEQEIKCHAQGGAAEIEDEGHGPALYAEVECVGLAYIYRVNVHGQSTEATRESRQEQEVTNG